MASPHSHRHRRHSHLFSPYSRHRSLSTRSHSTPSSSTNTNTRRRPRRFAPQSPMCLPSTTTMTMLTATTLMPLLSVGRGTPQVPTLPEEAEVAARPILILKRTEATSILNQ